MVGTNEDLQFVLAAQISVFVQVGRATSDQVHDRGSSFGAVCLAQSSAVANEDVSEPLKPVTAITRKGRSTSSWCLHDVVKLHLRPVPL